jgi:hypothetical protein
VTAGLGVREGSGAGITDDVLPMRHLQGINLAEMRPERLAQVTEPGRLASELDHVQHEGVDPGGLVHGGGEGTAVKLLGAGFKGRSTVMTVTG